jgi:SOS-response transcriptional repressor LexA
MPVCTEWAKGEERFCVRVKGESMEPTLWDEDSLLMRRQAAAENDAIAVALMEGEGVVKGIARTGHYLTLKPDHDAFPTRTVNLTQQTVQILGKAVGVYRKS